MSLLDHLVAETPNSSQSRYVQLSQEAGSSAALQFSAAIQAKSHIAKYSDSYRAVKHRDAVSATLFAVPPTILGKNVQFYREGLGLTQKDLAKRVGTAPPNISLIETGKRRPKRPLLTRIADALETTVKDLDTKRESYDPHAPRRDGDGMQPALPAFAQQEGPSPMTPEQREIQTLMAVVEALTVDQREELKEIATQMWTGRYSREPREGKKSLGRRLRR